MGGLQTGRANIERIDDQSIYVHRAIYNREKRIHILDRDISTVESLSTLFRLEGYQTAFSTGTGQFFEAMGRGVIDVAVVNFELEDGGGLSVLRKIKAATNGLPVFMLADTPKVDMAVAAMKFGAHDVLAKPIDHENILGVVRDALRRDVHMGAVNNGARTVEVRGFSSLTPRERGVLQLIVNGHSNKTAGRMLGISSRTVEVHRARVMQKLEARNTADLMRIVLTA